MLSVLSITDKGGFRSLVSELDSSPSKAIQGETQSPRQSWETYRGFTVEGGEGEGGERAEWHTAKHKVEDNPR